jgi:hypothetical protein
LKANHERSNLATAKIAGVSDKTVGAVRSRLEARSEIPNVTERVDTLGRRQPPRITPPPIVKEMVDAGLAAAAHMASVLSREGPSAVKGGVSGGVPNIPDEAADGVAEQPAKPNVVRFMPFTEHAIAVAEQIAPRRRMIKAHNHRKRGRALRKQREEEESPS